MAQLTHEQWHKLLDEYDGEINIGEVKIRRNHPGDADIDVYFSGQLLAWKKANQEETTSPDAQDNLRGKSAEREQREEAEAKKERAERERDEAREKAEQLQRELEKTREETARYKILAEFFTCRKITLGE